MGTSELLAQWEQYALDAKQLDLEGCPMLPLTWAYVVDELRTAMAAEESAEVGGDR